MAFSTRAVSSRETLGCPFSTRETVPADTLASLATSRSDAGRWGPARLTPLLLSGRAPSASYGPR
jgi:hypothetical protein